MNYYAEWIPSALKMVSALALVLTGLVLAIFFTKRMMSTRFGGTGNPLIRVVASSYIGVKKNISLVQVPGALLVLGISGDNIRLLTKIEDRKILDEIKDVDKKIPGASFVEQLHKFSLRIKEGRHAK